MIKELEKVMIEDVEYSFDPENAIEIEKQKKKKDKSSLKSRD